MQLDLPHSNYYWEKVNDARKSINTARKSMSDARKSINAAQKLTKKFSIIFDDENRTKSFMYNSRNKLALKYIIFFNIHKQ